MLINKIYISDKEWSDILDTIDLMDENEIRANAYCPSLDGLKYAVSHNLRKFIPFLLWVDQTGEDTDENDMARNAIEGILKRMIEITD